MGSPSRLLRLGPDARRFAFPGQFHVDLVRVAAHGAVLDVLLLVSLGEVDWDDDPLAACRANVRPRVLGASALAAFGLARHKSSLSTGRIGREPPVSRQSTATVDSGPRRIQRCAMMRMSNPTEPQPMYFSTARAMPVADGHKWGRRGLERRLGKGAAVHARRPRPRSSIRPTVGSRHYCLKTSRSVAPALA
jgi:hypothetical protein